MDEDTRAAQAAEDERDEVYNAGWWDSYHEIVGKIEERERFWRDRAPGGMDPRDADCWRECLHILNLVSR